VIAEAEYPLRFAITYSITTNLTRLEISARTLRNLEAAGIFEPRLQVSADCTTQHFYPEAATASFHATYISYKKVSKLAAFSQDPVRLLARFEPAFDFGGTDRLYRRSDLA
jgi:hypothetical protein